MRKCINQQRSSLLFCLSLFSAFVTSAWSHTAAAQNEILVNWELDFADDGALGGECVCDAGGGCTLRAAIQTADQWIINNCAGAGTTTPTILIPPGHYVLSPGGAGDDAGLTGDLDIHSSVIVQADLSARQGLVIIDGGFDGDDFDSSTADRVFDIHGTTNGSPDPVVELNGLHIRGGRTDDEGGGLRNTNLSTTIVGCTFEANFARAGGALANRDRSGPNRGAHLNVYESTITGNVALYGGVLSSNGFTTTSVTSARFEFATFVNNRVDNTVSSGWSAFTPDSALFSNSPAYTTIELRASLLEDNRNLGTTPTNVDCAYGNQVTWLDLSMADQLTDCQAPSTGPTITEPELGALRYWGGSTLTHMPSTTGAAVDQLSAAVSRCQTTNVDQRGVNRRTNNACDLGAVETLPCAVGAQTFDINSVFDTIDTLPGDGICADSASACSLRAAVMEANACPNANTIQLQAATYALDRGGTGENYGFTGDLDITAPLTILGPGANSGGLTQVDARLASDRAFHIPFRNYAVHLSGFEVVNSVANDFIPGFVPSAVNPVIFTIGGGVLNQGSDTRLDHMAFINNEVQVPFSPPLYQFDTHYSLGAAFANLADCKGSGVNLTVRNVTLSGNQANQYNQGTVASDARGAAYASVSCDAPTLPGEQEEAATTDVEFATITANYSRNGPTILFLPAEFNPSSVNLKHRLANSIIYGNLDSDGERDAIAGAEPLYDGVILSPGITSDLQPQVTFVAATTSPFSVTEPTDVGGPTRGYPLVAGGEAVDRVASSTECSPQRTDQRYYPRSRATTPNTTTPCDVGALEYQCGLPATYLVTHTEDLNDLLPGDGICANGQGTCTLRAAIDEANACPGEDTVRVTPGTYFLTIRESQSAADLTNRYGDLDVVDSLILEADPNATPALTIIDGSQLVDTINPSPTTGIIDVYARRFVMRDIQLQNGVSSEKGGALFTSAAEVLIERCTFKSNHGVDGGAFAMGIDFNNSPEPVSSLTIVNSTFDGNSSDNNGGAVHVDGLDGTLDLTIDFSTFTNNQAGTAYSAQGGGIFANGGQVFVSNTLMFDNSSSQAPIDDAVAEGASIQFSTGSSLVADMRTDRGVTGPARFAFNPALPSVAAIADNGGYTESRLPPTDSQVSALVLIGNGRCTATERDQTLGDRLEGNGCDVGSVEIRAPLPVDPANPLPANPLPEPEPEPSGPSNSVSANQLGMLAGGGCASSQFDQRAPWFELLAIGLVLQRMRRKLSRTAASSAKSG